MGFAVVDRRPHLGLLLDVCIGLEGIHDKFRTWECKSRPCSRLQDPNEESKTDYETTVALLKRENLEIAVEPYLLLCLFCAGCWWRPYCPWPCHWEWFGKSSQGCSHRWFTWGLFDISSHWPGKGCYTIHLWPFIPISLSIFLSQQLQLPFFVLILAWNANSSDSQFSPIILSKHYVTAFKLAPGGKGMLNFMRQYFHQSDVHYSVGGLCLGTWQVHYRCTKKSRVQCIINGWHHRHPRLVLCWSVWQGGIEFLFRGTLCTGPKCALSMLTNLSSFQGIQPS